MPIKRLVKRLFHRNAVPEIRIESFAKAEYLSHAGSNGSPKPEGEELVSQLCRYETLCSPTFQRWLAALGIPPGAHRKLWELAYMLEALSEAGVLREGTRGLGFAVGREPLPAFLASLGCQIVATDLADDDKRNQVWAASGQWADGLKSLELPHLCPLETFRERVSYRPVDMNEIPNDLREFDFTWSTCSFEHCGSIELGIRFLENQMKCLKPGGLAVHTTEFNLTSNQATSERGATSIYRLRDIEEIVRRLETSGHNVMPLDLRVGDTALDRHVDTPAGKPRRYSEDRHMRLALGGFACTSIGLIIRKAGSSDVDTN
jgi:hypothetical protein